MIAIQRYAPGRAAEWDAFVRGAKNASLLFERGYMDYHADRFEDHSLMVHDESGTLLAVLPASRKGPDLNSHGGLTYGGFITNGRMHAALMLRIMEATVGWLREAGFSTWMYKAMPAIFHRQPAQEDLYALFRMGAKLVRRDLTSVVSLNDPLPMKELRQRGAKKARKAGLQIRVSPDLAAYWRILEQNLAEAHGVRPVHTVEEITLLQSRFPESIQLHAVFEGETMVGGTVMFDTPVVAHAQYIGSTARGRELGALDLLFATLIQETFKGRKTWFNFGVSTEDGGRYLNEGLAGFKEGFGARTVVHDFYHLDF